MTRSLLGITRNSRIITTITITITENRKRIITTTRDYNVEANIFSFHSTRIIEYWSILIKRLLYPFPFLFHLLLVDKYSRRTVDLSIYTFSNSIN